jgi:hypothetical protein
MPTRSPISGSTDIRKQRIDHRIRQQEYDRRAKRLRSFEVDDQLELCGQLDGKVCGALSGGDCSGIGARVLFYPCQSILIRKILKMDCARKILHQNFFEMMFG